MVNDRVEVVLSVSKHAAPTHPGTGTGQEVHGGGGGIRHNWMKPSGDGPHGKLANIHGKYTSMVPIEEIIRLKEFDRSSPTRTDHLSIRGRERVAALAKDIKENGWNEPVIIEVRPRLISDGTVAMDSYTIEALVVEGNHRIEAAELLGMTHVPAVVLFTDYPWRYRPSNSENRKPPRLEFLKKPFREMWRGSGFKKPSEAFDWATEPVSKHGSGSHDDDDHGNWASGGKRVKLYHLTDDPKFKPNPDIDPPENALSIYGDDDRKGLYLTDQPEYWVNAHDYVRPFIAEIEVDESLLTGSSTPGSNQVFLPAEAFESAEVKRLLPTDHWVRETYGSKGWVEEYLSDDPFDPFEYKGYKYEGQDVRDMTDEETKRMIDDTDRYLREVRGIKKHGSGSHDDEDHGNWADGNSEEGISEEEFEAAIRNRDLFNVEVAIGGETYTTKTFTKTEFVGEPGTAGQRYVSGSILNEDGEPVGRFFRSLWPTGEVGNDGFYIEKEYQRKGISFALLEEWDQRLAQAGFVRSRVHAVNEGRYAWAKYGYEFAAHPQTPKVKAATRNAQMFHRRLQRAADSEFNAHKAFAIDFLKKFPEPTYQPHDIAFYPGGKEWLLDEAPTWDGSLDLTKLKKAVDYATWMRAYIKGDWSLVENDDPNFIAAARKFLGLISKHASPVHPGTGTGQDVHGGGGGGAVEKFTTGFEGFDTIETLQRQYEVNGMPVTVRVVSPDEPSDEFKKRWKVGKADADPVLTDEMRSALESIPEGLWEAAGKPRFIINDTPFFTYMKSGTQAEWMKGDGHWTGWMPDGPGVFWEYSDGSNVIHLLPYGVKFTNNGMVRGEKHSPEYLKHVVIHELSHGVIGTSTVEWVQNDKGFWNWKTKDREFADARDSSMHYSLAFKPMKNDAWKYTRELASSTSPGGGHPPNEYAADAMAYIITRNPAWQEIEEPFYDKLNAMLPDTIRKSEDKASPQPMWVWCNSTLPGLVDKHYGPGPHPSGSEQGAHAGAKNTEAESSITRYIDQMIELQSQAGYTRRTQEQLLKEHGKFYRPPRDIAHNEALMEQYGVEPGYLKECYANAGRCVVWAGQGELTYVEGLADNGFLPVHHAWLVTKDGQVIDPTWGQTEGLLPEEYGENEIHESTPGTAYFGIPFTSDAVRQSAMGNKVWGMIGHWNIGVLDEIESIVAKHASPVHPGTGTGQEVHGGGGGRDFTLTSVKERRILQTEKLPGMDVPRDIRHLLGVDDSDEAMWEFHEQAYGEWVQWDGSKNTRVAALNLIGVDDVDAVAADPHIDSFSPVGGGGIAPRRLSEYEQYAIYFMDGILEGGDWATIDRPFFRAVDTANIDSTLEESFWHDVREGDLFDAPLLAFLDHEPVVGDLNLLDKFGTGALLEMTSGSGVASGVSFSYPFWTQSDEDNWIPEFRENLQTDIETYSDDPDEGVTVDGYTRVVNALDAYTANPTKQTRTVAAQTTAMVFGEDMPLKFAGYEITEDADPDAFYAWFDEADYADWAPHEVISGGRFRVKRVKEDPRGTFGKVIEIEQIGAFDPTTGEYVPHVVEKIAVKKLPFLLHSDETTTSLSARVKLPVPPKDLKDRVKKTEDEGFPHGPSIKWPRVYRALRRAGMSKEKAAAISNAHWNKYRRWGRAGSPGPRSAAEYKETRGRKPRRAKGIPLTKHGKGSHDDDDHGNWADGDEEDGPPLKLDISQSREGKTLTPEQWTAVRDLKVNPFELHLDDFEVFTEASGKDMGATVEYTGFIYARHPSSLSEEVKEIGWFTRTLYRNGTVYNREFHIDTDWQGEGIGSALIHDWEKNLAELGFHTVSVTATQTGKYAWAKHGYDWDDAVELERVRDHVKAVALGHLPRLHKHKEVADWFVGTDRWISPAEIAMRPGGKDFLLSEQMPGWSGKKSISRVSKMYNVMDAYLKFLDQWFEDGKFKEFEQDSPEFIEAAMAIFDNPPKVEKVWTLSKHPGPDGGEIHSTGSDQTVHGRGRLKVLRGERDIDKVPTEVFVGVEETGSTMSMASLPEAKQKDVIESLRKLGYTEAEIDANLEKVIAYAEKIYAENPGLRDEHRFYERWFDALEDAHRRAGNEKITLERFVGLGAVISPGLEAETNLHYAMEMTRLYIQNPVLPDYIVDLANKSLVEKRDLALADRWPDDYYDKSKAGKPKKPSPRQAAKWDYVIEYDMRLNDIQNPWASIMAIRDIYNRENKGSRFETLFTPYGYDPFAKGWEIISGRATVNEALSGPKVRSFYNNILDPTDVGGFGDVTVDFQMAEAALMRRSGRTMPSVVESTPSIYGVGLGIRPAIADSVRRLTKKHGERVNATSYAQMQEVIWAAWKHGKDNGHWGDLELIALAEQ